MPILTGIMPVAPTAFDEQQQIDSESQRRVTDFLVDAEVDGICIMANYSEHFSLSDDERSIVIATTIDQADERVPVCVATSHFSSAIANSRNREAQNRGASMIMMMPPFYGARMSVDATTLLAYFQEALDGITIPLMLQDSPLSTTILSAQSIVALAREFPILQYAKIETANSAAKIREIKAHAGADLPGLFDGEEAVTLIPDFEAGAIGAMTSSLLPEKIGLAARTFLDGDRQLATALWEDVLPLIQYENRQCGLRAMKEVLYAGGVLSSARTRSPIPPMDSDTRAGLLALARRKNLRALEWGVSSNRARNSSTV
ncbi:dihydrodipicolinate synthase family protein [Nocardia africana]|uniref:Dihydrodipicolinate synthase family protein n=1 Tax=Nocardia africana TaxID=134964 RepID=A0ABW6NWB1_9NOCA